MAATVYAPVEGFTGLVVGVAFDRGVARDVDLDASQARYLRSHGYGIGRPAEPQTGAVKVDRAHKAHVGSPLADAAQSGRRVTLLVDGAVVYDAAHDTGDVESMLELIDANTVEIEDVEPAGPPESTPAVPVERPNVRDGKAAWVAYALGPNHVDGPSGHPDPDQVAAMTKEQLTGRYGPKSEEA